MKDILSPQFCKKVLDCENLDKSENYFRKLFVNYHQNFFFLTIPKKIGPNFRCMGQICPMNNFEPENESFPSVNQLEVF